MRIRIGRAVVVAVLAMTAMTGVAQAAPTVTGSQANNTTLAGATAMAISGNYAYAVAYWSGQMCVYDVSNPAVGPTPVGTCTASSSTMTAATNITISGNYAYVTSKNRNGPCMPGPQPSCASGSNDDGTGNSLTIVNISNPTAPTVVGSLHDSTNLFGAEGVAVSGGFAYVASQGLVTGQPTSPDTSTGSFSVINVSNPAAPVLVASIANASLTGGQANALEHATSVAISGTTAFVTAEYDAGVTAIDISNPATVSASSILSTYTSSTGKLNNCDDIAVSVNYAYVVNQSNGGSELTILNVSNPSVITGVGTLSNTLLQGAYRVAVRGTIAYVAANNAAAVDAVDVATPTAPTLLDTVQDTTHLRSIVDVAVDPNGQYVLAASPSNSGTAAPSYPPYPLGSGGPIAPTGTISQISLGAAITPSSEPPNPTTSTSADFAFTSVDTAATFTCSLDGATPGGCSGAGSQSYTGLSAGSHTFTVQASDPFGLSEQDSYTWTVAPTSPPANSAAPTISGTAQQGQTLVENQGTWTNAPTSFTWQWFDCTGSGSGCAPITNATTQTYTVAATDVGFTIEVQETAHNAVGMNTASSAPTAVVTALIAPPPAPPGAVSSASGVSTNPGGTAMASDAGNSVLATGTGALTLSKYGSVPSGAPAFPPGASAAEYVDVEVATGSNFSTLTVTYCNLSAGNTLYWLNHGAWVAVSPQSYDAASGCASAILRASGTSPTIGQLTGTVFAVAYTAKASAGRASVSGTKVSLPVHCVGSSKASCKMTLTLTVKEKVKGKKVTVTLGSTAVRLVGGQRKTETVKLNGAGRRLLASLSKLSATLTVMQAPATVAHKTVVFKEAKHK